MPAVSRTADFLVFSLLRHLLSLQHYEKTVAAIIINIHNVRAMALGSYYSIRQVAAHLLSNSCFLHHNLY